MKHSYNVELQPTETQRRAFLQHAGCARWAWNWGLARKKSAWEKRKVAIGDGTPKDLAPKIPTAIDLHRELVVLKKTPIEAGGVPWMYESSKWAPQVALRNLDRAFEAFFRRCKSGGRPGHPKFKARNRGIGGFCLADDTRVTRYTIRLPKIGRVRLKPGERDYIPHGVYKAARVTECAGRWFVSVTQDVDVPETMPNGGPAIGVDLGVVRLATLSDGTVFENPRALERQRRCLRHAQRILSRRVRGSHRRAKARARLARVHRRIANIRKDATHKATTRIAKNHGVICIEDLKVANMTRRARGRGRAAKTGLTRVVQDANFAEFRRMLTYKARLYGAVVVPVNAAFTSQTCSQCGHVEAGNRLTQATFRCLSCGRSANADVNAAINILVAGSCPETENARGADVRRQNRKATPQLAVKRESAWSAAHG